ncbi:dockerin type I domain-containing protein [Neorhodopirellula lusitana]|uniref:dockerin type I domain-containing protein n=1 Tax=Neorhodopirellula lusitana TaxID=445327 RepID=UPI00384F443C
MRRLHFQRLDNRLPLAGALGFVAIDESLFSVESLTAEFATNSAMGTLTIEGSSNTGEIQKLSYSISNQSGPQGPPQLSGPSTAEVMVLRNGPKPELLVANESIPLPLSVANDVVQLEGVATVYGMDEQGVPAWVDVVIQSRQIGLVQTLEAPDNWDPSEAFIGEIAADSLSIDGNEELLFTVLYLRNNESLLGYWSKQTATQIGSLGTASGADIASSRGITVAGTDAGADIHFQDDLQANLLRNPTAELGPVGQFVDFRQFLADQGILLSDFGFSNILSVTEVTTDGMTELYLAGTAITPGEQLTPFVFYAVNATPFTNPSNRFDVSGDEIVTAFDALLCINQLNSPETPVLGFNSSPAKPFLDVSGDLILSALDALQIINFLNEPEPRSSETIPNGLHSPTARAYLDLSERNPKPAVAELFELTTIKLSSRKVSSASEFQTSSAAHSLLPQPSRSGEPAKASAATDTTLRTDEAIKHLRLPR